MNAAVVIPALNPDRKLLRLVEDLKASGCGGIVVVDDGSDARSRPVFEQLEHGFGCAVGRHEKNLGKGEAVKTGIRLALSRFPQIEGIVTADADGQHLAADIVKIAEAVTADPEKLTLGIRDLSGENVPFKSRWGNRITSLVFHLATGIRCPDTQTGLRGIPASLFDFCLAVPGTRYEYEMNMLTEAAKKAVPLRFVRIETVYLDNNRASHFDPFRDSMRVYGRFLRSAGFSLLCAGIDLSVFSLLAYAVFGASPTGLLASTAVARILSGAMNFTLNKKWAALRRGRCAAPFVFYFLVFPARLFASWALVALLAPVTPNLILAKAFVDIVLLFAGYPLRNRFVSCKSRAAAGK
ncbi:MAG TPA: glycosyltransferase [Clostridiales bacterium]|nr:glycosyltransferase [Clostridiales bacterium]HQH62992.1 glycosyltransferase [Clostridiales bacterium]HQK72252.1 glycosyltransferase [Clostridiales bacterium]